MSLNLYLLFLSTIILSQKTLAPETAPHILESVSAITAKIPTNDIVQGIHPDIAKEYREAAAEKNVDEKFLLDIDAGKKIVPVEESGNVVKKTGQDCKIHGKRLSLLSLELFTLTSEQKSKLVGEWFAPNTIEHNKYPFEIGDLVEIKIYLDDSNRIPAQHWAVYKGDGWIHHLKNYNGNAIIEEHVLSEMYGNHYVRRNNSLDRIHKPLPGIMDRAASKLGCQYKYSLLFFNCELYVNDLRYGMASSMQVRLVFRPLTTTIVNGVAALPVAPQHADRAGVATKQKGNKNATRIALPINRANLGS